jgi:hypothetical protein
MDWVTLGAECFLCIYTINRICLEAERISAMAFKLVSSPPHMCYPPGVQT